MATLKQRLHRKNGSAYDIIHMETESNVVLRPSGNTVETDLTNYLPKVQNSDDVPQGLTSGQIVTGNTKVFVCTGDGTIRTFKEEGGGSVPVKDKDFTYTGNCEVIDDSTEMGVNWRIKFLTSGVLTLKDERLVDVFLVGGGGDGGTSNYSTDGGTGRGFYCSGAGGGGGYTKTVLNVTLKKEVGINIIIPNSTGSASIQGYEECSVSGGASGGAGIWSL